MTEPVLLVEDDTRLAEMVASYLGGNGFDVTVVASGEKALLHPALSTFQATVLDVMLPGIDGLEFCRRVKAQSGLPIIMLTAKGDPMDRIIGLEIGADDYLPNANCVAWHQAKTLMEESAAAIGRIAIATRSLQEAATFF